MNISFRVYLERYMSCSTSADVKAAQESLLKELEDDYANSRRHDGENPWLD